MVDNKFSYTRGKSLTKNLWYKLVGTRRNVNEPSLFHELSFVPILAWIGLGADGLSSSAYGPEEAFRALGPHTYLAIFIAIATALTVFIIAYAYSRIIEHFPNGGGGYMVATRTISKQAGVISGSVLLVDYVLTIAISLTSCGDAIFSFLPPAFLHYKMPLVIGLIILLVFMNIRGLKESVTFFAPIFVVFLITHVLLIGYGLGTHFGEIGTIWEKYHGSMKQDFSAIGLLGIVAIFLRAFPLGDGTYAGIEAISNGINVMREPKVQTGKRTMLYVAVSLAVTASGLIFAMPYFPLHR